VSSVAVLPARAPADRLSCVTGSTRQELHARLPVSCGPKPAHIHRCLQFRAAPGRPRPGARRAHGVPQRQGVPQRLRRVCRMSMMVRACSCLILVHPQ